jgi:hypothetical protein
MAEIARMTVKMPKLRLKLCIWLCHVLTPLVRSEETGAKIGDAMMAWIKRGLRVYANGQRIA